MSKVKTSFIVLSGCCALALSLGLATLTPASNQIALAAEGDAIALQEGSGAAVRPYESSMTTNYEGIRFIYELNKTEVDEKLTGEGEITAEMLFLPTVLLNGADLTKDTANVATFTFSDPWTDLGDNYKFVATLYNIPANYYDFAITTVMCFTQGETSVYSAPIARDIRNVARAAYDNDDHKEAVTKFLKDENGNEFTVEYAGTNVATESYLWGDTVEATGVTNKYFKNAADEVIATAAIRESKVTDHVSYNAISALGGEIMYSTKDNTAVNPYADATSITAIDGTEYYNGTEYTAEVPKYESTATGVEIKAAKDAAEAEDATEADIAAFAAILPTNDVLVYGENGVLKGYATMKSYTKVIDEKGDYKTEFDYVEATVAGETSEHTGDGKNLSGYYIVAGNYDCSAYADRLTLTQTANPNYANDFNGYFDGNGKTLNVYLQSGGILGDMHDAVMADFSIIVDNVRGWNGKYNHVAVVANSAERSILENLYVRYEEAVKVSGNGNNPFTGETGANKDGALSSADGDSNSTMPKTLYGLVGAKAADITTSADGLAHGTTISYHNVILDVSNIPIVSEYNGTADYYIAAPIYGGDCSNNVQSINNFYIIQSREIADICIAKTNKRVVFAENDSEAAEQYKTDNASWLGDETVKVLAGLTRYATTAAMAEAGVDSVGSFAIAADGTVSWAE